MWVDSLEYGFFDGKQRFVSMEEVGKGTQFIGRGYNLGDAVR